MAGLVHGKTRGSPSLGNHQIHGGFPRWLKPSVHTSRWIFATHRPRCICRAAAQHLRHFAQGQGLTLHSQPKEVVDPVAFVARVTTGMEELRKCIIPLCGSWFSPRIKKSWCFRGCMLRFRNLKRFGIPGLSMANRLRRSGCELKAVFLYLFAKSRHMQASDFWWGVTPDGTINLLAKDQPKGVARLPSASHTQIASSGPANVQKVTCSSDHLVCFLFFW